MFIFMFCLYHGVAMILTQCNERGKVCKVLMVQKWGLIITIRVIILITWLHIAFGIWFSVNASVVDRMHSMKCQNKEENEYETCRNRSIDWTSLRLFQAMPKFCLRCEWPHRKNIPALIICIAQHTNVTLEKAEEYFAGEMNKAVFTDDGSCEISLMRCAQLLCELLCCWENFRCKKSSKKIYLFININFVWCWPMKDSV